MITFLCDLPHSYTKDSSRGTILYMNCFSSKWVCRKIVESRVSTIKQLRLLFDTLAFAACSFICVVYFKIGRWIPVPNFITLRLDRRLGVMERVSDWRIIRVPVELFLFNDKIQVFRLIEATPVFSVAASSYLKESCCDFLLPLCFSFWNLICLQLAVSYFILLLKTCQAIPSHPYWTMKRTMYFYFYFKHTLEASPHNFADVLQ